MQFDHEIVMNDEKMSEMLLISVNAIQLLKRYGDLIDNN
jgi:hypothetical protein